MLGECTSEELSDWMAYAELEPFGEERADLRAALVTCTIANVHRDKKKRRRPYLLRDFMLYAPRVEESHAGLSSRLTEAFRTMEKRRKEKSGG